MLRRYLGSLFADKHKATWRNLEDTKILMKGVYPKRIDFLQPFCVDDCFSGTATSFCQGVEQFMCRSTIKISNESKLQVGVVSLNENSEV